MTYRTKQTEQTGGEPPSVQAIREECDGLRDMLLDKNRKYGNSALMPLRLFSSADAIELINVRIDDKLSRIQVAKARKQDDDEDAELDLIGYLILKRVARRLHAPVPAESTDGQ